MNDCKHEHFQAHVDVNRLTRSDDGYRPPDEATVVGFSADIAIHCADCEQPFRFIGLPVGLVPDQPTSDANATQMRAPIEPVPS